jgi:hypothetical protein
MDERTIFDSGLEEIAKKLQESQKTGESPWIQGWEPWRYPAG